MEPRRALLLTVAACALAAPTLACSSEPSESAGPITFPPTVETTIETTTTTVPVTAPPTTMPWEQIGSCVEHAQFRVFTGDPFWTSVWNDTGQSAAQLQAVCEQMAVDDPDVLQEFHEGWLALQVYAQQQGGEAGEPSPFDDGDGP